MRASVAASRRLKLKCDASTNKASSQSKVRVNGKQRPNTLHAVSATSEQLQSRSAENRNRSGSKRTSHTPVTPSSISIQEKALRNRPTSGGSEAAGEYKKILSREKSREKFSKVNGELANYKSELQSPVDPEKQDFADSKSPFLQSEKDKSLLNDQNDSLFKLKLAMSSANAFKTARSAPKVEEKNFVNVKKRYYRKAIILMCFGGVMFSTGVVFAILHFSRIYQEMQMIGPVCLAIGLLMLICGLVWLPIIKTKLKRQQQVMSQTFTL